MNKVGRNLSIISGVSFFTAFMLIMLWVLLITFIIRYFFYIVVFLLMYHGHLLLIKYLNCKINHMVKNRLWRRFEKTIMSELAADKKVKPDTGNTKFVLCNYRDNQDID
jgi:Ca2+/Na+ antiporter